MKLHRVKAGVFQSADERFSFRLNRTTDTWSVFDGQTTTGTPLCLSGRESFTTLAEARTALETEFRADAERYALGG